LILNCQGKTNFAWVYKNIKFNFVSYFVSLMFLKNKKDIKQIFEKTFNLLEKWWYMLIYEAYSKRWHFTKNLEKNWLEWYLPHEIDNFINSNWFEKKWRTIFLNKTIFWKWVWYLTEIIWINLSILIDILIPWGYTNFITIYQKK